MSVTRQYWLGTPVYVCMCVSDGGASTIPNGDVLVVVLVVTMMMVLVMMAMVVMMMMVVRMVGGGDGGDGGGGGHGGGGVTYPGGRAPHAHHKGSIR